MYEAHTKREQAEKASEERIAYISGLVANTNLDDGKGSKRNTLENVDNTYYETLKSIYNIEKKEKEVDFENDPFFKAMKIPGKDIPVVDEHDNIIESTARPEIKPHDHNLDIDIDQA